LGVVGEFDFFIFALKANLLRGLKRCILFFLFLIIIISFLIADAMIYKYHSNNEFLFQLLIDNSLWFSKVTDYNDPFDMKFNFEIFYSKDFILESSKKMIENLTTEEETKKKQYLEIASRVNPISFSEETNREIYQDIQNFGVCCFSKSKSNILMWSHYANGHKGVCLGFDFASIKKERLVTKEVTYSKNYPVINNITEVIVGMTTKSLNWKYEKEVRMILFGENGKLEFPRESIKEVIFGCRMPQEEMERITKVMKFAGYKNLIFKKAILEEKKYSLKLLKL